MALLFSESSTPHIHTLADQLESLAIKNAENLLNTKIHHYSPWMSNAEDLPRFSRLHNVTQWAAPEIVLDSRLSIMSECFKKDGEHLTYLYPNSKFLKLADPIEEKDYLSRFAETFTATVEFIKSKSPSQGAKLSRVIHQLIPLSSYDPAGNLTRRDGTGLSSHAYRGGVFLSLPRNPETSDLEAILNLSHELGHQVLQIYQCGDRILTIDLDRPWFSVVRRTFRPAIMSFHATVVCGFMIELILESWDEISKLASAQYFSDRVAGLVNDLNQAVRGFDKSNFTQVGQLMCDELRELAFVSSKKVRQMGIQNVANL